jgi:nitrogen fixation NifU-like protein
MNPLYKEHLIELYSKKDKFGEIKDKTKEVRHINPVCEDEVIIDVKIENGHVLEAKFRGKLCFISTVSAEALMENILGMSVDEIKRLKKEDIDRFLGVEIISTRTACELLPLEALKKL